MLQLFAAAGDGAGHAITVKSSMKLLAWRKESQSDRVRGFV